MYRFAALRAALVGCALLGLSAAAQAAVLITVDKSAQQMTVEVDGRPLHQWPVSTGRAGYDTPNGKFKAFRMERDHFSKEWDDAPMPHSIFFTTKGHAIHGSHDVKKIGRPASAGCVRLAPENAKTLFELVEQEGVLNTTVVLTGVAPSNAPAVARPRAPRPDLDEYTQPRYRAPQGYPAYGDPYAQDYPRQRYVEPLPAPRYVQPAPRYADPYATPRGYYYYQDPYYGAPAYRPRYRGGLFD